MQDVESNEITVTYMLLIATSSVPVVLCFSTHRNTHTHNFSEAPVFVPKNSCGGASEHVTGLSTELNLMVLCESSSPSQDGSVGSRPTDVQNERNLAPASLYHRFIDCSGTHFQRIEPLFIPQLMDEYGLINMGEYTNW